MSVSISWLLFHLYHFSSSKLIDLTHLQSKRNRNSLWNRPSPESTSINCEFWWSRFWKHSKHTVALAQAFVESFCQLRWTFFLVEEPVQHHVWVQLLGNSNREINESEINRLWRCDFQEPSPKEPIICVRQEEFQMHFPSFDRLLVNSSMSHLSSMGQMRMMRSAIAAQAESTVIFTASKVRAVWFLHRISLAVTHRTAVQDRPTCSRKRTCHERLNFRKLESWYRMYLFGIPLSIRRVSKVLQNRSTSFLTSILLLLPRSWNCMNSRWLVQQNVQRCAHKKPQEGDSGSWKRRTIQLYI